MYEQKEIVLIPFPYTDLTGAKKRPALILSNSLLNKTQDRICVLITSNPTKDTMQITTQDFEQGSLPFESWVKPYRIFTIHEKIIIKKLCTLTGDFHDKILQEVIKYLKKE